tara:strand:- start:73 stop:261 length:189 start_codon:yes stop_codon:yes gene_type:complete
MALPAFLARSISLKLAKGLGKRNKKNDEPTRFEFNDKKNPDEDAINHFIRRSTALKMNQGKK